ncbi:MAG TPA: hypothetical protein VLB50_04145 [Ignavibacteriaceae bacterium]|nr:hypothetical protein [Ignavibacteriaceae bacterium]
MKCREVKYYLNDYLGGKLIDEMRNEIWLHLNKCHSCRKRSGELKVILKSSGTLHKEIHQGGELWEGISELSENDPEFNLPAILYSPLKRKDAPQYELKFRKRFIRSKWIGIGAPFSAILVAVLISVLYFSKTTPAFWQVESLKGTPVAGSVKIDDSGILPVGEWLTTDSRSKARLKMGMTGEVDVDPGSAVQLVSTKENDYKIYLKLGKIHAKTWAPANLFSVIIPSAYVIDPGGTYTIEVDKSGSSFLQVSNGNVVIKSGSDKEIVPAGAVCETMKNRDPGTPYLLNTSTEFKEALSRFDFGNRTQEDLEAVLDNAGVKDALSLWYLLRNARPDDVQLIYNKLAELVPPPGVVTCEGIKNGNGSMLLLWWEKLGYGKKSLWNSIKG